MERIMKLRYERIEKWNPIQILDIQYYPQCYSISLKRKHVICFALCQRAHPEGICFLPNRIFPVVLDGEMTVVFDSFILASNLTTKEENKLIEIFEESYKKAHEGKS